jgi:hypothetical protein
MGRRAYLPITVSQHVDRREYKRQYRFIKKKTSKQNRTEWLRWKYKLTDEDYENLLDKQKGRCAICGTDDPGNGHKHFHVDHCHNTNLVRGLLCHKCNKGLGLFKDDSKLLKKAVKYLDDSSRSKKLVSFAGICEV